MANSEVSRLRFNDTTYEIADELARESIGTALTEVANVEAKADSYNTALSGRITNLENSAGAVLVAKTRTAMTDTNKIYVYTGSTTTSGGVTYTAGHWYFHDGSNWTDGGVFTHNMDAIDATLTQSNKGADAKVTGDRFTLFDTRVSDLNSDISEIRRDLYNALPLVPLKWQYGLIGTTNGVYYPSSTTYFTDPNYYRADNGDMIHFNIPQGFRLIVYTYTENKTYINRHNFNASKEDVSRPYTIADTKTDAGITSNTYYLRFSVTKIDASGSPAGIDLVEGEADGVAIVLEIKGVLANINSNTYRGAITSTTDLDALLTPGIYTFTSTVALNQSIFRCFTNDSGIKVNGILPSGRYDGYLRVSKQSYYYYIQTFITNGYIATRKCVTNGDGWGQLTVVGGNSYFGEIYPTTRYWPTTEDGVIDQEATEYLEKTTDLNDLYHRGIYYIGTNDYRVLENRPCDYLGIIEILGANRAGNIKAQRFTGSNKVYFRRSNASGKWFGWADLTPASPILTLDIDKTLELFKSSRSCYEPWTPTANTMPIAGSKKNSTTWNTYSTDMEQRGLPYSTAGSVNGVILTNRNLDTFYSAIKNPYSVLYTKVAGTPSDSGIKASFYGTACSTYACAMLGYKYVYNTDGLRIRAMELNNTASETDIINPISNIEDIRPGDVLLITNTTDDDSDYNGSNHTIVIEGVQITTDNNLVFITSESIAPRSVNKTYTEDEIRNKLNAGYVAYRLRDCPLYQNGYTSLAVDPYPEDVIPEYGANTWYIKDSTFNIKVWLPNSPTNVYIKSPNGDWSTKQCTLDSNKVMNITQFLDDYGTYEITTDSNYENALTCKIQVIHYGVYTVSGNVFDLHSYRGCRPSWFEVFYKIKDTTPNSETSGQWIGAGARGRKCYDVEQFVNPNTDNEKALIDVTDIINNMDDNKQFRYIKVYYDTGYGLIDRDCYSS